MSGIDRDLTKAQELQLEFWTGLKNTVLDKGSVLKPQKPLPQGWTTFAIGKSEFNLAAVMNIRDGWARAELNIYGKERKTLFRLLLQDRAVIESELGLELEWGERPDKKNCQLLIYRREVDFADKSSWGLHHVWLADMLERMHTVFASRIRNLDPNDYSDGISE